MRFANVARVLVPLLLSGSSALAAVLEQRGNTCTVSPGGGKSVRRRTDLGVDEAAEAASAAAAAAAIATPDIGPVEPKIVLERFPRPEPGSPAAKTYDRVAAYEAEPTVKTIPFGAEVEVLTRRDVDTYDVEESEAADPDDTPVFMDAFKRCGQDGSIIFTEGTYNIRQVMNTTNLRNCDISIYGKFVWSVDNLQYWLRSSYSVTYAGRSTAWLFGGVNVSMRGYGKALFDGNGQVWIDQNRNQGNQNGRPISLTIWHGTNIYIDGITWRMAQFWHTFVAYSQNVTMTNLDMKSLSNSSYKAVNTDGTDTWNSKDIVISNWTVACGDDCISVKANSTNVHVSNVVCQESGCACVGSMGNSGSPEYVDNVIFKNITCKHSSNAAWIKTYSGNGHVRNVTFEDIQVENVDQPIYVTPCIYSASGCDTSRLAISDVTWRNVTGTSRYNVAVGIHCPASAPCKNFKFENIDIKPAAGGTAKVLCSNIQDVASSGLKCTGSCPADWPQQLKGNR